MDKEKAEEIRLFEKHLAYWHLYHREHPDSQDANDTANLLGNIIKRLERRI